MARRRYKPQEIASLMRQAKVLHGQGKSGGRGPAAGDHRRDLQSVASNDWTLLTKVETSCDRILIAGGTNVEAEWEQGPAV